MSLSSSVNSIATLTLFSVLVLLFPTARFRCLLFFFSLYFCQDLFYFSFSWLRVMVGSYIHVYLLLFVSVFFFFYCTFRDDDINTYITLARNEWNSSWVAAVARGSAERRCATRSSFFERAPALIPLFTLLCSHFKRNIAKGSTYQNKHVLLKLIMNKQN